ncbi:hypothetical protein [Microbulbifer halophilus]|uniref:Uncharacterized protein n=2 Tax=Microbulbifer halophilus TaxID=453963 RepID=A0ABW5E977_9GAMM
MRFTARGLIVAGLLTFSSAIAAQAGFSGDEQNPTLHIVPTEIAMDVPMPVSGANLTALLARADNGASLSDLKEAALRKYRRHLRDRLSLQLNAFFTDEAVPLVAREGLLTLQNRLDIKVIKHLSNLKNEGDYELERGTVELKGRYYHRLRDVAGRTLREYNLDIADLGVREEYRVRKPRSGGTAEDNTEEAIKLALSGMVEEILDEIDGELDAGELEDLVSG